MNKIYTTMLLSLLLGYINAQGTWISKSSFKGGVREGSTSFSIGTKGYLYSGSDDSGVLVDDLWEWNQSTNSWTQKASIGIKGRFGSTGFSIGSKGYISTGYDNTSFLNDLWEWDQTTNAWNKKADLPASEREFAVAFAIGNKGYVGTGQNTNSSALNDFWEWDQTTDTWTKKSDCASLLEGAVGFSIGTKGYIGTGWGNSGPGNFWEWDQVTDVWIQRASFPGVERRNAIAFSIGSYGFLGTGSANSGGASLSDFWKYDQVNDTWVQLANYKGGGRDHAIGFAIGTKAYIGTGHDNATGYTRGDFWEWSGPISSGPWQKKAAFPGGARRYCVGFSIGSKGYIGTGEDANLPSYHKDFWEWDPLTNIWTQKADFGGTPRTLAEGFSIGTKGYIGLGWDSTSYLLDDFWEYNSNLNTWKQIASFPGGPRYVTFAFSIGTFGYIGTGHCNGVDFKDFWEWNQATDTWTKKADFAGGERVETAAFTIGSKGYVGTGRTGTLVYHKDLWEWDQSNDTWTKKSDFGGGFREGALGFAIDAKGYIGTGGYGNLTNDFWEYDPIKDSWVQQANFVGPGRVAAVGFSVGNKGYIGTGFGQGGTFLSDFWQYTSDTAGVWPGDANNDFVVNNNDLLTIGLCYGETGGPRSNISNNWQSFPSADWKIPQTNGYDMKHADCNGDGIINANDTLAINLNSSLTHSIVSTTNSQRQTEGDIYLITSNTVYKAGDWVNAEVWIGDSATSVKKLYGVSFNIKYDASLVNPGTESITYPNSWLGNPGTNAIKFSKIDVLENTAQCAITRIDHKNARGYGKIADFKFQLKNNIPSKIKMVFSFSDYTANDSAGVLKTFNTSIDSIDVIPISTGLTGTSAVEEIKVSISPNPMVFNVTLSFSKEIKSATIKIIDLLGKEVRKIEFSGKEYILEKGELKSGIYFLQVISENELITNAKMLIQ